MDLSGLVAALAGGSGGRAAAYAGHPGQPFGDFQQQQRNEILKLRSKRLEQSIPFELLVQTVISHLASNSSAHTAAVATLADLQHYQTQATRGFFPPAKLPPATLERIKLVHGVVPAAQLETIITSVLGEVSKPIEDAARVHAGGNRLATEVGQPAREAVAADPLGAQQQQPAAAEAKVTVGGLTYDPHLALLELWWAAMALQFRFAGEAELKRLMDMRAPGSQGPLSLPAWMEAVQRLFSYVQHLPLCTEELPFLAFIQGLNDEELRQQGQRYHSNNRNATLQQVLQELQEFEQHRVGVRVTDTVATAYGMQPTTPGAAAGNSSSAAGAAQPAAGGAGASSSTQQSDTAHTYNKLYNNGQVKSCLAQKGMQQPAIEAHLKAMKASLRNPSGPAASCCLPQHSIFTSNVRPHTNQECRVQLRQQQEQQQSQQAQQTQAQMQQLLATLQHASQGMAGQALGPTPYQQPPVLQLSDASVQQLTNSITALLAHQAAAGMPVQTPRSVVPQGGGGRMQQQQQQQRSSGPCGLCGFRLGHPPHATCYCADPATAYRNRADWRPSSATLPQGVMRYVQACVAGGLQLRLHNVGPQVQQLLNEGRFNPQEREAIRQSLQQPAQALLAALGAPLMQPPPAQQLLPAPGPQQQQQPLMLPAPPYAAAAQQPAAQPSSSSSSSTYPGYQQYDSNLFYSLTALSGSFHTTDLQQLMAFAAETRGQARSRLAELVGFVPKGATAPDPNTAAGGRHQGVQATQQQPSSSSSSGMLQGTLDTATIVSVLRQLVTMPTGEVVQLLFTVFAQPSHSRDQGAAAVAAATSSSGSTAARAPQQGNGSSSSSSSSTQGSIEQALNIRPLFPLPQLQHEQYMRGRRCLHRIVDTPPGTPSHVCVTIPGAEGAPGRILAVFNIVYDDGCNWGLTHYVYVMAQGIRFERREISLLQSDGNSRQVIIGITEPLDFIFAQYSPRPLRLRKRLAVLQGDAGGLFNICLGTETMKEVYAFVHPLFSHLCWYPDAPRDFSLLHGVPVTLSYPDSTFLPGLRGELLSTVMSWAGPDCKGLLLDVQMVIDSIDIPGMFEAKGVQGAKERLQLLVGDVRQPFPAPAQEAKVDVLLMKHFLSAFSDADCVTILNHCKQCLAPSGAILLLQTLVPEPGDRAHNNTEDGVAPGLFAIEIMAMCPGGAWRTLSEWQQLFAAAGLDLDSNTAVGCNMSLMVWRPRPVLG